MPVPVYSLIADGEIDPESPLTSSLMFRLRDNWMAVLGVDTTNPSPTFSIPPSTFNDELVDFVTSGTTVSTLTTSERVVSVIADSLEMLTICPREVEETGTPPFGNGQIMSFDVQPGPLYGLQFSFNIYRVRVNYSSGSPTSITINNTDITLTNTWQTVQSNIFGTMDFEAKARSDANNVYLQLRLDDAIGADRVHFNLRMLRRFFKNKAAI